jgi:hypothetical protein
MAKPMAPSTTNKTGGRLVRGLTDVSAFKVI